MELNLNFAQVGGVDARSIGEAPPDCGPKAQAQVGPDGHWMCVPVADPSSLGRNLVLVASLVVLFMVYSERWGKAAKRVSKGDLGALL